jgi:tetratricopeptide (TPR) repeat protein
MSSLISYSHDSAEHEQRVRALADQLRDDGIDARIDQYVQDPDEGWVKWMRTQVKEAEKALLVFTETYQRRFEGDEEEGKGLGATFEGVIVTQSLYESGGRNAKFRPVVFRDEDAQFIPVELRRFNRYRVDTPEHYQNLLRWLYEAPRIIPPRLGQKANLPPDPSLKLFASKPDKPPVSAPASPPGSAQGAAGPNLPLSNIPDRNPFFTGREPVLTELQETLAEQRCAVVSGLGGIGKTLTVVEYVHRHSGEYTHAFWATAGSREALSSGYTTIVSVLEQLPQAGAQDQTLAVEKMKRWLGAHENWLLVLDNADDLAMAREFIPSGNNGHVILTTRELATGAIGRRLDIKKMGTDEGALLLLRRAKYIPEDAPLDAAAESDQMTAKELSKQLDGLPLALDQGGAYIEETACGLLEYLRLYQKHAPELLQYRGLASDHPDPVATTWVLSFEKIEQANPAATELLRLCAFLHPDAIPEELFREGAPELGPELQTLASDGFRWNNAISNILKYSLLRRDPKARTLEIHRLVQEVLKQGMDENTQRLWAERAVRAVARSFPKPDKWASWPSCERLVPQANHVSELAQNFGFTFTEAAILCNDAAAYLVFRGRYSAAEHLYQRTLALWEKSSGSADPDLARILISLAEVYRLQRHYAEAERLYKRALEIQENDLGPRHQDVGLTYNGFGLLYWAQGRYSEAEPLSKN